MKKTETRDIIAIMVLITAVAFTSSLITWWWSDNEKLEWSCDMFDSPLDRINEDDIHIFEDKIVIDLENTKYIKFADSGSMLPCLDKGHNAIEIIPSSPTNLKNGDIISYKIGNSSTIHRIVSTGTDIDGWYAKTKGDNNKYIDSERIRFDDITGVVVVMIY